MSVRERLYRFRSFWIFPCIGAFLLYISLRTQPDLSWGHVLLLFGIGVFIWTFLEYILHRFVFHIQIPIRDQRWRDIINGTHLLHHASPRDPGKILVHPVYGLVVSTLLYGVLYAISRSATEAAVMMTGIWAGFLYYEAVHYRVHVTLSNSGLVARQRRTHFYHHFTNNKQCFGVTTPLWDYVFGTTARPVLSRRGL